MPGWLRNYRRELLPGDIGAGIIVALLMVPQGMAYAIVAGLSPITGLYASILPPLAYALFGTSMTQSVGPQAITALLVAGVLAPLALPASPEYVLLAARLALLTGLILFACGLLRLGFLVNYLSQPVMSGFTNGAVLLIAAGQVPSLPGAAAHRDSSRRRALEGAVRARPASGLHRVPAEHVRCPGTGPQTP